MKDMHRNSRFSTEITPQPAVPIESSEQSDKHEHVLEKDDSEAHRKSKRQRIGDDFTVYLVDNTPTSIAEVYASPNVDNWKEAIQSEMDSILFNGTCELTE